MAWFNSGKKYEEFCDYNNSKERFNLFAYMNLFSKATLQIENELIRRQTRLLEYNLREGSDRMLVDFPVETLLLDSSPGNRDPEHLHKISHVLPDSKLIFMMRDPVERTLSAYRFRYQTSERRRYRERHQNAEEFHNYVINELSVNPQPFTQSYYNISITTALQLFKRENLLFVKFEDYIRQPSHVISQLFVPFLGVAQYPVDVIEKWRVQELSGKRKNNSQMKYDMKSQTRVLLRQHFSPFNHDLALLLHDDTWSWGY